MSICVNQDFAMLAHWKQPPLWLIKIHAFIPEL